MDLPTELRDFLVSRRARLAPEDAGVQPTNSRRRVKGLRREEVAHLAGVSVEYYTRFERGRVAGVSTEVVEAVARALQLDDIERDHLRNLVRAFRPLRGDAVKGTTPRRVPAGLQAVLDAITVPAFIQNERIDLLAANALGYAIYPVAGGTEENVPNLARFLFLDSRASEFYRDRDLAARNTVAILRGSAGKNPDDEDLINLIGHLSTKSAEFRELWAGQDVLRYRAGAKRYGHPVVGDLEFSY